MAYYNVNSENGNLIPVAGGTLYADTPIGTIIGSGVPASNPPAGYLYCDGRAVSRTTYAALFAAIGTAFGTGDGSTTFNIPDLRGEFIRGAGTNSHTDQGNGGSVGYHQDATTMPYIYANGGADNINFAGNDTSRNFDSVPSSTNYYQTINSSAHGSSTSYNFGTVRPTNTSINFFIKATNVAVPADLAAQLPQVIMPDYARGSIYTAATNSYTMPEDGYIQYVWIAVTSDPTAMAHLLIDGYTVSSWDANGTPCGVVSFSGYVKKGAILTNSASTNIAINCLKVFGLA